MTSEQLAGAAVLAVLGLGTVIVGILGRPGSLDFALGGWTRDAATPDSWHAAHRAIGWWFVTGGALAGAGAVLIAPAGAVRPVVVSSSVALAVSVVVGVVVGTNRVHAR